jgi:pyruvate/2-oxoglutarate/acetoin dehydrogenase E1 component
VANPDVTLLTYGGMLPLVEEAARALAEEELACEIVAPALLSPMPRRTICAHLRQRRRIVIVEECHTPFGVGAEFAAVLLESGFTGSLVRIGTPPVPIPAARSLEGQVMPGQEDIVRTVLAMF